MRDTTKYGLAAVGLVFVSVVVLRGCGGYGEVSSGAYAHATALYSICNRRDADRLTDYAAKLDEDALTGKVSPQEAVWLEEIVALARAGDWTAAAGDARQMLSDQVQGGP